MTIHILVAVHNRCSLTRKFLSELLAQSCSEPMNIVVVDDGSTDGTAAMLDQQCLLSSERVQISVIHGDGTWWWAKSMANAMDSTRHRIEEEDVVVFMNDDISVPHNTVEELARSSRSVGGIVKATLRDIDNPKTVLDRGCLLDPKTLSIVPLPLVPSRFEYSNIDIAPGRTVAYPGSVFTSGLNINYEKLPHHLADLEFSVRASREGFPIRLAEEIYTLSINEGGLSGPSPNIWHRLTHISSPDRLGSHWAFWRTVLPDLPKWSLAWRLFRFRLFPNLLTFVPRADALLKSRDDRQRVEDEA